MRTLSATAALTALLVLGSAARGQVLLRQKVQEGTTTTASTEIETSQTLTLGGMEIDTASSQLRKMKLTSGRRAADGTIRVKHTFEDFQASITLPGDVTIQFDSDNPNAAPTGTRFDVFLEILKATAKTSWTLVHDANNRVVKVEIDDDAIKALDENTQSLIAKQFNPDYLKEQANSQLDLIPATPVSPGDTWQRNSDVRLEGGQHLDFVTEYQYTGTVKGSGGKELDRIAVRAKEVDYSMDADAPTPLKLVSSDLKIENAEGQILFDRELGQAVEHRDKVHIVGEITFSVNGNQVQGKLDLTMEHSTKRE